MYKHNGPKITMMILVILHFSITTGQWADQMFYNLYLYRDAHDLLHSVVFVIVMLPFAYTLYLFIRQNAIEENTKNT